MGNMLFKFSLYGFLKNLQFFEPFLYLFFLSKGLSYFQIGILIGIREVCIEVFEVPTGIVADLLGRRRSMIFSFSSYIVSFVLFYISGTNFVLYIAAMFVFAAGEAFRTGTHKAIIMDYLDITGQADKKVKYYGTTRAFSKLGSALSAILAALIVFISGGYNVIFLASIVPYIGGLLLMLSYPKSLDVTHKVCCEKMLTTFFRHTKESFVSLFKIPGLGRALLNSSTYEGFFKVSKDYLQPILKQVALALPLFVALQKEQRISIIIGCIYMLLALLSAAASKSSHRFLELFKKSEHGINTTFFATAAVFAGIGVLLELGITAGVIFLFVAIFVFENLRKPALVGYIGDKADKKQRATILSVDSQLKSLFAMLAAPLLGFFADKLGLPVMFLIAGGMLMIFALLFRVRAVRS